MARELRRRGIVSCYVWLSRDELVSRDACSNGLALFDSIAAMQGRSKKIRLVWNALSCVWLAATPGGFLSWLWEQGLVPMASLRRAHLSGANLSGAYLSGADLSRADLSGADLSGADLIPAGWERGPCGLRRVAS